MMNTVESTWRVDAVTMSAQPLLALRHVFAYEAAIGASRGSIAVDLACGSGYGGQLLRSHFAKTVELDLAMTALGGLQPSERSVRVQGNATNIPLRSGSVDLVVGFQLLEHVTEDEAVRILREIRRVLRPGGVGYCTTPNANLRLYRGQKPWNPYHVVEYRPDSMRELCRHAGLPAEAVRGIVGINGAQEFEEERLRPNWSQARTAGWSERLSQARMQAFHRLRRRRAQVINGPVDAADRFYAVTTELSRCIDFLVVVRH